ncbi:SPFH domain-containing protein [Nocardiopsis sp. FR26]|uniref:SPFH domain-containing protein n=1 Tax=Nocardiopsis sp. FR26 TaxID=2605987 RepID=UPI001359303B|nr:SPFH domain-containing protein [Nocardiopsis sp. FR26]
MTVRRTTTIVAAVALALGLTACTTSVEPDELGIEYDAGLFSSTTFDGCVNSGTRVYYGPGDDVVKYPGGQRTFAFNNSEDNPGEMGAETVVTQDGMEMTVSGVATFQLNPDCGTLQQFHEAIGRKYDAHKTEGWERMLKAYVGEPLRRALDDASTEFEWRDLYTSDEAKAEWETRVGELLKVYVAEMGGGDFFIGATYTGGEDEDPGSPTLTLQRPVPPGNVREAMTEAHRIAQEIENTESAAELAEKEAEAIAPLVDLLGADAYVLWEAIKAGDVDVVAISPGAGVGVTPGRD